MEIKFRGKDIKTGEWVYGYYGELTDGYTTKSFIMTQTVEWGSSKNIYFTDNEVGPATVGQYTGKKDRHGTEIYSGTRIQDTAGYVRGVVSWSEDDLAWIIRGSDSYLSDYDSQDIEAIDDEEPPC